jgi:hypothetical protein
VFYELLGDILVDGVRVALVDYIIHEFAIPSLILF